MLNRYCQGRATLSSACCSPKRIQKRKRERERDSARTKQVKDASVLLHPSLHATNFQAARAMTVMSTRSRLYIACCVWVLIFGAGVRVVTLLSTSAPTRLLKRALRATPSASPAILRLTCPYLRYAFVLSTWRSPRTLFLCFAVIYR